MKKPKVDVRPIRPTALIQPQFVFRARTWGTEHWICPYSGHLNRSWLNPRNYSLNCVPECNRRFIPGRVLYPSPGGPHSIPPDWVIPLRKAERDREDGRGMIEAFPTGDLSRIGWRRHNPVHVLVNPNPAAEDEFEVGLFVQTVRRLAQEPRGGDLGAMRTVGTQSTDLARLGAAFLALAAEVGL